MLLKSLKLSNIRSYLNETINFPEGSVLLEGDIGSGKSTILLAIEYALFGIKTAHYNAFSLLRHGKKEGYVELKFSIENKDYTIHRNLKRGKNDIKQEAGYIIKDDVKKDGTSTELKSMIFEILGYPRELLTKGKDVIYRFTVYTPQEEMKQILFEEKDIRLDTLRKVFGIDKYKRIRENAALFIRNIKEKNKENEGKISDLLEKKEKKRKSEQEIMEIEIRTNEILPKLDDLERKGKKKEEELKENEEDIKKINQLNIEFNKNNSELKNKVRLKVYNEKKIDEFKKEIKDIEEGLKKKIEDVDPESIKKNEADIKENEEVIKEIHFRVSEFKVNENQSDNLIENLKKISKCPVCRQDVSEGHKENIIYVERKKKKENEIKKMDLLKLERETEEELKKLKDCLNRLNKQEHESEIYRLKTSNLNRLKKNKDELEKENENIKEDVSEINKKQIILNKEIEKLKDIETIYNRNKEELNIIKQREKDFEIKKAELDKEAENINKIISMLAEEITYKLKIRDNLDYLKQLQNWLENYFIKLTNIMERNIMLSIYRQFNELFQDWFNILIEEESLQVRLDDEFTPIIEQNGYETSIENLSGGEKTSVALSYRLALNKVVNDFIGHIKTKDLIILDEPTDGFSTEQLDKVRDVIDQLNMKQVIIVSHENKIESFVDNVIRISKDEHISRVY